MFTQDDAAYMREAILLASRGEGRVSPNPPVGCVLVKDGRIVGRGWHDRLGDLHAEAMALRDAGGNARGATAYITLSPCTSHGRQPPCSDALIRAGVAKAIAACRDPNPANTSGLEQLRQAGIEVADGLLREEAEYLARGFFSRVRRNRPFVTHKYAMTLDGKIATATGDSRWVSGPASRELVQDMRSRHDAVMVGVGTVLADDPALTVRDPVWSGRGGEAGHRQPLRVIVDSRASTPPASRLFDASLSGGPVLIFVTEAADTERGDALRHAGAEVVPVPARTGGVSLEAVLSELARRGVGLVLSESGSRLGASLVREGWVDEIVAFIAAKLVGGDAAFSPFADIGVSRMAEARRLAVRECKTVDHDIVIRAGFE